jgi:outer membrane protein OmpA-like peptidoglycan-associated protein
MRNKVSIFTISLFILAFVNNCSSQSNPWYATSGKIERDTIKAVKKGVFIVKGIVTADGQPLKGVNVRLDASYYDLKFKHWVDDIRNKSTLEDGSFEIKLGINNFYLKELYRYSWYKEGYNGKRTNALIRLPRGTKGTVFTVDLQLEMVPENKTDTNSCGFIVWSNEENKFVASWSACSEKKQDSTKQTSSFKTGERIILKNISFEVNKSILLPSSNKELNKLADNLIKNKNTVIEICGHTDNTGSEEKNKALSEARAKAVADYLISKGIDKTRTSYIGYGSTKPIAKNDTEEGRQLNRRVEFLIKEKEK